MELPVNCSARKIIFLFPNLFNLGNACCLYSACSDPTDVVLVIA
jgi:hypothetical protein